MKWFNIQIGGQKWRVDLVRKNYKGFEGENLHGLMLKNKCRVYISREQEATQLEDTLLHELLHAALYVSRGHQVIVDLCADDEDKAEKAEEDIVEKLVLVLHPMLKELGFVFPKVG